MNIDNNDHSELIDFDDESNAVLLIQHNVIKQLRNLDNCFNTSNTKGDKTYQQDFALINNFAVEADFTTLQVSKFLAIHKDISARQAGKSVFL